jgi:hypothetical protein
VTPISWFTASPVLVVRVHGVTSENIAPIVLRAALSRSASSDGLDVRGGTFASSPLLTLLGVSPHIGSSSPFVPLQGPYPMGSPHPV